MKLPKLIKQYLPDPKMIKNDKTLKLFGKFIHDPNLWHLNRYSVATAFSVGLFSALLPIPFQIVLAASLAIIVRANLPISVALVFVSNPITTPPLAYFCYKIGTWILGKPEHKFEFQFSFEWLFSEFSRIGVPLMLGSFVAGIFFALIGNLVVRLCWRLSLVMAWRKRLNKRNKSKMI